MPEGFQPNRFVKVLTFTDLLVISGFGLINPIFAVFLTDHIKGGSLALAGLAVTIFLVTKSLLQIPVAWFLDTTRGEEDDFYALCFGYFLVCLVPFLYIFSQTPAHIILIQVLNGVGGALTLPAWTGIFSRHLDQRKASFDWSFYSTTVSLAAAATATIGAFIAQNFGFKILFFVVGFLTLWASISTLIFYRYLKTEHPSILKERRIGEQIPLVRWFYERFGRKKANEES